MQREDFDIAKLFAGFLAGNLTAEEQAQLEDWIAVSEKNRLLFEKVCRGENFRELNRMATSYDSGKAWQGMEKNFQPARKVTLRRWMAWAAVMVLPLCIGYFLLRNTDRTQDSEVLNVASVVKPGTSKAMLTMADGSVVELKGVQGFELKEKDGTLINKDSAILTYAATMDSRLRSGQPVYNRVDIPRGGEYSLVLSDGTVVYLNAMSSLRYPVNFVGDTREVELTGEAFFQVAKDASHPFIVKTREMSIRVLGTEFNVSAYQEDQMVRTTLVEGSVRIDAGLQDETVVLRPSQQATFYKSSGELSVREVNVDMYIAWKNGMFDFRDWRLEDIMTYLSRWYDIQVFYQNEGLKDQKFGCYITRYSEIGPILELLEKTGNIKADVKGNTIVFTR